MISKFIKEQKRYQWEELKRIFEVTDETLIRIIKRLKTYGVLKTVRSSRIQLEMSDLMEEDIEMVEEDTKGRYFYVFSFVGIIIVEGRILKCYPKYINKTEEPVKELKQILKVLQKYHSKEQILPMYDDGEKNSSFQRLSFMISFLMDYYENGIYQNEEQIIETNGRGEIIWDRTINDTYPMIQKNKPFYMEPKTRKRVSHEDDFLKQMHEIMLTSCSRELEKLGLLTMFDLMEVELTDRMLSDLGDTAYLLYRLEREKSVQFQTRKQYVLAMMEALISDNTFLEEIHNFSIYGTNHFHLVWEDVCAKVFHNKLNYRLDDLQKEYDFVLSSEYESKKNETLKSIIEKPKWTEYGKKEKISLEAKDTFIPDLVTLRQIDQTIEFIIFDAKYYVIKMVPNQITGQPGIEAITKQYLYQLAYQKFLNAHHINRVKNCFIMPAEEEIMQKHMEVRLEMMEAFQLERIEVRSISAMKMYEHYLNSTYMDLELVFQE